MNERCLLIKTKDRRKFLTHKRNLPTLIEFSKTFNAEIYMVEPLTGQKILGLKTLTAAICSTDYYTEPEYVQVERILPKNKKDRLTILSDASKIRQFIKKRLLTGNPVSLKELKDKYESYNLTDACLCNHLSVVRKQMLDEGHSFKKVGAGKYSLCD